MRWNKIEIHFRDLFHKNDEWFLESSKMRSFLPYGRISGAWARPIYGKPIQRILGRDTDRYFKKLNRPPHRSSPEIEISKKILDEFTTNRSVSRPRKLKFRKISGRVFQDLPKELREHVPEHPLAKNAKLDVSIISNTLKCSLISKKNS